MKRIISLLLLVPALCWGQTYPNPIVNSINGPAPGQVGWIPNFGVLYTSQSTSASTLGNGYQEGDTITISGGVNTSPAVLSVMSLGAVSATVSAAGTGGTNGACTVTSTVSVPTGGTITSQFQLNGTISGGALTGALTVSVAGVYGVVLPTNPIPVSGCGLTGATVNINSWGVVNAVVQQVGNYTQVPSNPVAQASTSGSGAGATFNLSWGPLSASVPYPGLVAATGGNTFTGSQSGQSLTTGTENTCYGVRACATVTTGGFNTGVGVFVFQSETTGFDNTAIGEDTQRDTNGNYATVSIGNNAMRNTDGHDDVAIGYNAMWGGGGTSVTQTVSDMVIIGSQAANNSTMTTAHDIVGIGYGCCQSMTSAIDSVFVGSLAGNSVTTGGNEIFVGYGVGQSDSTGTGNIALGFNAMNAPTAESNSIYIGYTAGFGSASVSGSQNIGIGYNSIGGTSRTSATQNTAIGSRTGQTITSGSNNTLIGFHAGESGLTTGSNNLMLGDGTGATTCATGNYNILLGTNSTVDCISSNTSNEINIGGAFIGFSIAPTLTSGWGTSPTAPTQASTFSFSATIGATGTPSTTGVIGLPTAPNSWNCRANDLTSNVTARMTAQSTTSVTFTWSAAPSNSDVIWFACLAN